MGIGGETVGAGAAREKRPGGSFGGKTLQREIYLRGLCGGDGVHRRGHGAAGGTERLEPGGGTETTEPSQFLKFLNIFLNIFFSRVALLTKKHFVGESCWILLSRKIC